ncbi:substrate-binding domain-containing protein [Variovorax sp. dw_954]|uniref:molybdate ABC transporter substrate-binding protein n=1 Tax=Variovorax sp. dw_954 TaxID=2720078 RepID=UPI001BD2F571|nr:substrate-binding domain-containing protein [Variovorax sp. dw_954]
MKRNVFRTAVLAFVALTAAATSVAAEVKVLTAGAFKPVVAAMAPVFEQRTGHKLTIDSDTAGALAKRIAGGEAFDVAILTTAGIDDQAKGGKVAPGTSMPVARVGIGVAIKQGSPAQDIGSVAAFQQALLKARAVAMIDPAAGGSSGIYLSQLFGKMGIAPQMQAKAVLVPGGLTAQKLVSGEADIALQQISELMVVPGVTVLGPIPAEIQNYTVYAGGVGSAARDADAARAFLAMLAGPEARTVMKDKGMSAP